MEEETSNSFRFQWKTCEPFLLFDHYNFESFIAEEEHSILVRASYSRTSDFNQKGNAFVTVRIMDSNCMEIGKSEEKIIAKLNKRDPEDHTHIIRLIDTFTIKDHYCLVFEPYLLLSSIMKRNENEKYSQPPFSDIKLIVVQLLSALSYLRINHIIYGKITAETVAIDSYSEESQDPFYRKPLYVRLCNFSSAFVEGNGRNISVEVPYEKLMLAPEVIMECPQLISVAAMDMWSLGCFLVELYLQFPLFSIPKEKHVDFEKDIETDLLVKRLYPIITQIVDILGPFPVDIYKNSSNRYSKFFSEENRNTRSPVPFQVSPTTEVFSASHSPMNITSYNEKPSLSKLLSENSSPEHRLFYEFIKGLLDYDPLRRPRPQEALFHEFLFPSAFDLLYAFDIHSAKFEWQQKREEQQKLFEMELKRLTEKERLKMIQIVRKKEKQYYDSLGSIKEHYRLDAEARKTYFLLQLENTKKQFQEEISAKLHQQRVEEKKNQEILEATKRELSECFQRLRENSNIINNLRQQLQEANEKNLENYIVTEDIKQHNACFPQKKKQNIIHFTETFENTSTEL